MTASNASDDANGSGLAEYMYFVDNKAGADDAVVRKEIGIDSNPNTATFSTAIGRYLGQVAVVDKAGNISNVTADPDARTKMYEYALYSKSVVNVPYVQEHQAKSNYYWAFLTNRDRGEGGFIYKYSNQPPVVRVMNQNVCWLICSTGGTLTSPEDFIVGCRYYWRDTPLLGAKYTASTLDTSETHLVFSGVVECKSTEVYYNCVGWSEYGFLNVQIKDPRVYTVGECASWCFSSSPTHIVLMNKNVLSPGTSSADFKVEERGLK